MATAAAAKSFRRLARQRTSTRRFQPDRGIPTWQLQDILETTMRTPSSFNLQPTQIVLIANNDDYDVNGTKQEQQQQHQTKKEQLAQRAMLGPGNQYRTKDCSALAIFLSDLEPTKRIDRIVQLEQPPSSTFTEEEEQKQQWVRSKDYYATLPLVPSFLIGEGHAATWLKQLSAGWLRQSSGIGSGTNNRSSSSSSRAMPVVEPVQAWAYKNTSLVAQTMLFACESHGLSTCLMEGYDVTHVQECLAIPDRYAVPLIMAIGYDYEEKKEEEAEELQHQHHHDSSGEEEKDDEEEMLTPRLPIHEAVFDGSFGIPWKR